MAEIDHIVLGASSLEVGAAWVEQHLGVRPHLTGNHVINRPFKFRAGASNVISPS